MAPEGDADTSSQAAKLWSLFGSVEAEALINALRSRWWLPVSICLAVQLQLACDGFSFDGLVATLVTVS